MKSTNAEKRRHALGTGGGEPSDSYLTPSDSMVLELIGSSAANGHAEIQESIVAFDLNHEEESDEIANDPKMSQKQIAILPNLAVSEDLGGLIEEVTVNKSQNPIPHEKK